MSAHFLKKFAKKIPPQLLRRFSQLYPPFLGAGIRIDHISKDLKTIDVSMPLTFLNRNYVGTHFGGSMYAMTDPFFMIILLENLDKKYVVWDKSASIDFKKPGRSTLRCRFHITDEEIKEIESQVEEHGKYLFKKSVNLFDVHQNIVAQVEKTVFIGLKDRK